YLLSPFVPMIFEGEEWAASTPFLYFAGHEDKELARLVSEGRKREFAAFGWAPDKVPDPESPSTFEASKVNWSELKERKHAEMHEWYRALIRLRRKTPCLNNGAPGNIRATFDEDKQQLRYERGTIAVVCNFGAQNASFPIAQSSALLFASHADIRIKEGALELSPDSVAVLNSPIAADRLRDIDD
ncbi:MAG: DUF3459 domain-containing protein, partial [Terracidiphilus sp.]